MSKPTYYLWKNDFAAHKDLERAKEKYEELGFRVVTCLDGHKSQNIHEGLKAMIRNHYLETNV